MGNLLEARGVPVLVDEAVDEIQDLSLTLREGHRSFSLQQDPNKNRIQDTRTLPETQGSHEGFGILDRIVQTKEEEVESLLSREPFLLESLGKAPPARDLALALTLQGEVALMAEVKRCSPGAGPIRPDLDPAEVALSYEEAGAAAVSVLTDSVYFGGSMDDLRAVREAVHIPVFRKDFVIHRHQLLEARVAGADGVLLIARILSIEALTDLHAEAVSLGLTPLVEVRSREEVRRAIDAGARLIGVNNRNLQTFTTSLGVTLELLPSIPRDVTVVSESGIRTATEVDRLGAAGVQGILVGETLLRSPYPGSAAAELVGRPRVARTGR
jgi:indole-3-glycerol phosphate synthase